MRQAHVKIGGQTPVITLPETLPYLTLHRITLTMDITFILMNHGFYLHQYFSMIMLHIAANHPVAMPTDENNFPVRLNPVIF
jgi:hypothetical protein